MAVVKRLLIALVALGLILGAGLLLTYDYIKIEWISLMEIQPSFNPQEDPLPMPARSVPVQGAAYVADLPAPANPYAATENSLARGKYFYDINCALCHGATGAGNGNFAVFLAKQRPANLLEGNPTTLSDGEIFIIISEGIGMMPSLRQNLPEAEMRWSVVNYVRQLQAQAPAK